MSPVREYATDLAYKEALETHLKEAARRAGMNANRYRQRLVFDRFLGRLAQQFGHRLITKGGVALELRLERARTTKDVDVRLTGSSEGLLEQLQEAGRRELRDRLRFEVTPRPEEEALIQGDGLHYEGFRFKVEAKLAGKRYASVFPLDVAFGDILTGEVEETEGMDLLSFVGAPRTRVRLYPRETHVAEKLHAYTLPRITPNSRVKDLVDVALFAHELDFEAQLLHSALKKTFDFRSTHALPEHLPTPPAGWEKLYLSIAKDHGLPWSSIHEVLGAARAFLDPVLSGVQGRWTADTRTWR